MKYLKMKFRSLLYLIVLVLVVLPGLAEEIDPFVVSPKQRVNDFADILTAAEENKLEMLVAERESDKIGQIAVVTVSTLNGREIAAYTTDLANKWGVGTKNKDNGLLILMSTGDRKVFVATGYATESLIPDAYAKQIIEQILIPNFRQQTYYQGFVQAIEEISSSVGGKKTPIANHTKQRNQRTYTSSLVYRLVFFVAFIFTLFRIFTRRRRGLHGYSEGIIVGSALDMILGGRHGGGFGGSSFGGGFSGFGGGSFGGGGASGSW